MERWNNRVAVVTGASSGIGAACAKYLAERGMIVVGLARRKERIDQLREQLKPEYRKNLHGLKCDVSNEQEVIAAFKQIETEHGPIAVLVNNAGIARHTTLLKEDNSQDVRDVVNTNIMAIVWCTREAFKSMKAHGGDGHVFLINSIAGHIVPNIPDMSFNIYPPTKHAVTAMTEIYRQELMKNNTKVKITSISPGGVDTEIISDDMRTRMKDLLAKMPLLRSEDVADALVYCLQTPPHVQIHELTIKPMGEMF